jgi:hypothetical protein
LRGARGLVALAMAGDDNGASAGARPGDPE